jgi:hypothetical protein
VAATRADAATLYGQLILEQAPRVLSLMDRERLSPTAGCMDRTYWAWKFVDFPGARFQEGLCVLAFLHGADLPGNPYRGSAAVLEWIAQGMRFWCDLQHADGSFDEAYPYERSLAATAFTSFYIAEALLELRGNLPQDVVVRVQHALARAGEWLRRNDESHGMLSNHLAAAAAALHHIHALTGESAFAARSRHFLRRILQRQSAEGWYEEYGGADPGYQTHGSFYLARIRELGGGEELADSLDRAMRFMAHFVHPDGSIGGEYASRNTQTYYPAAFEMCAGRSSAAAWIAERMRSSVRGAAAAGLAAIDVYNYFPVLNNLVFAYRACTTAGPIAAAAEPSADERLVWFADAGIARIRRQRYDAWVGVSKGGVVKVFDRQRRQLVFSDCGYIARSGRGRLATTQYLEPGRAAEVNENGIAMESAFMQTRRTIMRPVPFIGFRAFTLTIGRLAGAGRWLKRQLVRVLIHTRRPLDARMHRTITFAEDRVTVTDRLEGPALARFRSLERGETFTTIHMGSSRYFIANELDAHAAAHDHDRAVDAVTLKNGGELRRVVAFD